ncbi:hypothetical protein BDK51DRAFT_25987 [Blyttiomyces helicus]|uniref:Uncharacterized protein n=1 Tax=Blyttiomyces helicus TaxID=388810 RepID=A0A4P9VZN3_9FUNG|nr:hypothetical protein BDK51DRAFT_25987 [Blyttiomyces helicus]|eukprot:RKO83848.1 hypothetical protein BDK51DRAFT_25987 [Blyttiomyces helicus]
MSSLLINTTPSLSSSDSFPASDLPSSPTSALPLGTGDDGVVVKPPIAKTPLRDAAERHFCCNHANKVSSDELQFSVQGTPPNVDNFARELRQQTKDRDSHVGTMMWDGILLFPGSMIEANCELLPVRRGSSGELDVDDVREVPTEPVHPDLEESPPPYTIGSVTSQSLVQQAAPLVQESTRAAVNAVLAVSVPSSPALVMSAVATTLHGMVKGKEKAARDISAEWEAYKVVRRDIRAGRLSGDPEMVQARRRAEVARALAEEERLEGGREERRLELLLKQNRLEREQEKRRIALERMQEEKEIALLHQEMALKQEQMALERAQLSLPGGFDSECNSTKEQSFSIATINFPTAFLSPSPSHTGSSAAPANLASNLLRDGHPLATRLLALLVPVRLSSACAVSIFGDASSSVPRLTGFVIVDDPLREYIDQRQHKR